MAYPEMKFITPVHLSGACECGRCDFELNVIPKTRFFCHCKICQAFTGHAYADMIIVRAKHLKLENKEHISFKKYRPPPNISRGLCLSCQKPVVEFGGVGVLSWAFIPASNFESQLLLPAPKMHIFYHRHVQPVVDDLPKYSGYFRSQLAISKMLFKT